AASAGTPLKPVSESTHGGRSAPRCTRYIAGVGRSGDCCNATGRIRGCGKPEGSRIDERFCVSDERPYGGGEGDLLAIARRLAETPISAIGRGWGDLGFPDKLARELLASHAV